MSNLLDNRYRVIQVLGAGGFGDTFLAEDTQMPSQRRCVIKQLKPITNNPQVSQIVRERFKREAAILEFLGHESRQIPNLFAYFHENDQFYLVQEWIDGNTLTQTLQREGKLGESAVRDLLLSILPVLELVHAKGIVHRDIKPDNIILRRSDRLPVLIDFGAVRETMGTMLNSQGNTTSSIVIGTPGYMPSEQAAGRPVFSSDLYSLGLTAVYLLAGKMPQDLGTDLRTGEIMWQLYAPGISDSFAQVINKAIQSHPRDRYTTATEMLEALCGTQTTAVSPVQGWPVSQPTVQVPPISQPTVQVPPISQPNAQVPSAAPPTQVPIASQPNMQGLMGGQPFSQSTSNTTPVTPPYLPSNNWLKPAIFLGASLGLAIAVGYFVAQRTQPVPVVVSTPTQSFAPSPSPSPPTPFPSPTPIESLPTTPPSPTPPPSKGDFFGAIARSREGGKGYSWNYNTRAAAEQRAITECSSVSTTKDCEVLVWFKNACGSIAEASNGGAGSGWGIDEALAEKNALESCSTVGSGCKITRTICSKQ